MDKFELKRIAESNDRLGKDLREFPGHTKQAACETWDYIAPQGGLGIAGLIVMSWVLKITAPTVTAWISRKFGGPKE